MNKKVFIFAITLGLMATLLIIFKFTPPSLLKQLNPSPSPSTDPAFRGLLVTTGSSAPELAQTHQISETTAQYQVVNFDPATNAPRHYLITNFTSQEVAERFAAIAAEKIMSCIDIIPTQLTPPPADAEYLENFTLVTVQDFGISDNLSCYAEHKELFTSAPPPPELELPTISLTAPVIITERPVYDISYDFAVDIPWSEAKSLGYSDASGIDHPADTIMHIFVIPANDDIAYQLLQAARQSQPITLQGTFMAGYAESTVLRVEQITQ